MSNPRSRVLLPLCIASLALAGSACGGGSSESSSQSATSGGELARNATRVAVTLSAAQVGDDPDADPPHHVVSLVLTDDTGATSTSLVGEFVGNCATTDEVDAGDLLTHQCWWAGGGVRIHVRTGAHEIILLREEVDEGLAQDASNAQELRRIPLPANAVATAAR